MAGLGVRGGVSVSFDGNTETRAVKRVVRFRGVGDCWCLVERDSHLVRRPIHSSLCFALLLTGLLVRYSPQRRDALGLLAGAAGVALVLGVVNLGYQPCPESGTLTMLSGEGSSSCGGVAPAPFFVVGVALMILGLGPYLFTHATEPA